jgi:hypothetical protein
MCVFPKRFHTSTQIHLKTIHIGDFVLPAALVQGALGSSPGQQPLQAALQQGCLDRAAWQGTFAETFLLAEKTSNPDNIEYEAMCKDI